MPGTIDCRVLTAICAELRHAEEKHPHWPDDVVHGVAILIEEAGEAMQAALNYHYENGDIEHLKKELAQVGAMAIRNLINLPWGGVMEQLSLDCEEEYVKTEKKLLECPRCRKPSKVVEVMPGARVRWKMCNRCEELAQEGI